MLTTIVVLPAAIVSGVQFPLLISLLGSGSDDVGRHVGLAYAWNTLGAIAGSLAGGFGLLPLLSAPGAWRLVIVLLALLGIAATFYAQRTQAVAAGAIAILAISGVFALGPTSLWRHSGIGAGRSQTPTNRNATREWIYSIRRTIVWDRDGRESSVALADGNDYAFIINGKADGSARGDAGTQVMSGMVGATLHPNPRTALVIGLGTGSTAGWLGAVPTMERVDVVELEPAVIGVAAACSAVNHDVLHNPKVKVRIGDAREVLLAARTKYDVIFSEPSNPYRAGIASLFTREFYEASAARLNRGGIVLQWVLTYDVDAQTIRTIYATIGAVFPNVTTWHTDTGDLLLLATVDPISIDADTLRRRVARPPFLSAMSHAWRVESVEGFLAHFVATDAMTRLIAKHETEINTDDRTVIEFGFARGVGADTHFDMDTIAALARSRGEDRPPVRGVIDWKIVDQNRASFQYINQMPNSPGRELQNRHHAAHLYSGGALTDILTLWRGQTFPPVNTAELAMLAESLADAGSTAAAAYAEQLRPWQPADADAILARLRYRQNDPAGATTLLARAWMECRRDPWPTVDLIGRTFPLADLLATQNAQALQLFHALDVPFAGGQWEDQRRLYRVRFAALLEGCGPRTVAALRAVEPWPPWRKDFLKQRRDCYASAMSPLADRANRDLRDFLEDEAEGLLR
jgi:spermidine synthase/uncharacterized membrane protein